MKNKNKLADQSIKQLFVLMKELNLPTTISQLGINVFENNNLEKIAEFTCRDKSEIHFLPFEINKRDIICLLYTSPSPRDRTRSRMPSSA